ncbi:hypothetical protein [Methanocalculus sp. MSAO_Arc2]|uniref:hypothetical protein n=1 Tax=Methanocalculus sp. MSAO_Arc2 TaxID=2293855 RepID=UPI00267AB2DD
MCSRHRFASARILISAIVLTSVMLSACVIGCTTTNTPADPEGAIHAYVMAFNRGDGEAVYSMLSGDAQSRQSRIETMILVDDYMTNEMFFSDLRVLDVQYTDSTRATASIAFTLVFAESHIPRNKTVLLIKEGNDWKLTHVYTPAGCSVCG